VTKSIDPFFNRVHTKNYNCLDFVREVWLELTGRDIIERLPGLLDESKGKRAGLSGIRQFTRLEKPRNPCLVLMQRAHTEPHIGIYLNRRILHLHERGVEFQPLLVARAYFTSIKYYV
jgi:hypothetical protein